MKSRVSFTTSSTHWPVSPSLSATWLLVSPSASLVLDGRCIDAPVGLSLSLTPAGLLLWKWMGHVSLHWCTFYWLWTDLKFFLKAFHFSLRLAKCNHLHLHIGQLNFQALHSDRSQCKVWFYPYFSISWTLFLMLSKLLSSLSAHGLFLLTFSTALFSLLVEWIPSSPVDQSLHLLCH